MAEDRSHTVASIQRRVVTGVLILAALCLVVGIPLMVNDGLRLDLAHRLHLVPGWEAEQIADGDDGVTLIVLPLPLADTGREVYRYRAQFLARPAGDGLELSDIESGRSVAVPIETLDHVAASDDGTRVLLRGQGRDGTETAVLFDVARFDATVLPDGVMAPDLPGDWETPVWEKTTGPCDRFSVTGTLLACFNRPEAASYLAGDWQIDVQVAGDFRRSKPVYRGIGFLPQIGWAHDDSVLYIQNEVGIWRIPVPEDLRAAVSG